MVGNLKLLLGAGWRDSFGFCESYEIGDMNQIVSI